MRTSGSRVVRKPLSPWTSLVSRARSSPAARRLPTSRSTRPGSAPARIRRAAAATSSVVFPVPGPPTTRSGPASWSRTRHAAGSHSGSASATRAGRTSKGTLASSGTSGPGTPRFDHAPPTVSGTGGWKARSRDGRRDGRTGPRRGPGDPARAGAQLGRSPRSWLSSACLVGRVLAEDGHDLLRHRVCADGTFAPHLAVEQAARSWRRPRARRPRPAQPASSPPLSAWHVPPGRTHCGRRCRLATATWRLATARVPTRGDARADQVAGRRGAVPGHDRGDDGRGAPSGAATTSAPASARRVWNTLGASSHEAIATCRSPAARSPATSSSTRGAPVATNPTRTCVRPLRRIRPPPAPATPQRPRSPPREHHASP